MMDVFNEHIVSRKPSGAQWVLRILILLAAALLSLLAVTFVPQIGLVLAAGIIYGAYWLFSSFNVEYEYILTNGELDVDKIVNRRKRKRVLTVDCRKFEVMAHVQDEAHRAEMESSNIQTKLDVSSGANYDKAYFCIFTDEKKGRVRMIFEPTEKMLASIKSFIPRKLFIKN